MAPISPSTCTTSPTRMESVNAICTPAKMFPKVDWAAIPATMEARPAEAKNVAPIPRNAGKVMRTPTIAETHTIAMPIRRIICIWVRTRRAWPVSSLSSNLRSTASSMANMRELST